MIYTSNNADKNLIFFDKEGNSLNFKWNSVYDKWEGDMIFHQNSTDTHKSQALYVFENVPSFDYELPGDLHLDKFQLFNEFGIDIVGNEWKNQKLDKISAVNNDSNFYSKWLKGKDFEKHFPIGSYVKFDSPILEFYDTTQIWAVVGSKKDNIMILSTTNNRSFNTTYGASASNDSTYIGKTISGANTIGFYNYIDQLYNNNYSNWSEPIFYNKLYNGRKLTLINTDKNDGVKTILNKDLPDRTFYKYNTSTLPTGTDLIIRLITKTDIPLIYTGNLQVETDRVKFTSGSAPDILRPGMQFQIPDSILNPNFITVDRIPEFTDFHTTTFFATQSQVMWEGIIKECYQAYTHSATSSITPDNTTFWSSPTYVPVSDILNPEGMLNEDVYLNTNVIEFRQSWETNANITLASAAEKFASDFNEFNIYLYYHVNALRAELKYPGKYAEVEFYHTSIGPTYSINSNVEILERIVETTDTLKSEVNESLCTNLEYRIVFTDIDEFGFKLTINKMPYNAEIIWVYTGPYVDMEKTIDATLRRWLTLNIVKLTTLGILPQLAYIGNLSSIYYNSIILRSEYPNVPFSFKFDVGTTADYYIEHSDVTFYDMGNIVSFNINGKRYETNTIFISPGVPNIPTTLANWVNTHKNLLSQYGIYVVNINNIIKFRVKKQDQRLDYTVTVSQSSLPAELFFVRLNRIKGKLGAMITSNEVVLNSIITGTSTPSTNPLEDAGFATGMVFSVNNTLYPFNNQEYNILSLDPGRLNLSYQGPFWGTTGSSICDNSSFTTIAFDLGFGATGCAPPPIVGSAGAGEFDATMFSPMFQLVYSNNNQYNLNSNNGPNDMVDIAHVSLNNSIYALGDNIWVYDSNLGIYLTTITLGGNTQSVALEYNNINNYLYVATNNNMFVIDPTTNTVYTSFALSGYPTDLLTNTINGDIYVSYNNNSIVEIYNSSNSLVATITTTSTVSDLEFNPSENKVYASVDDGNVHSINGLTRTTSTIYGCSGLKGKLRYNYYDNSIYGFNNTYFKISGGSITSFGSTSSVTFDDMIFNNLTNHMDVSRSDGFEFTNLDTTNSPTFTNSTGNYGYLTLNQYDGDIYMSSQNTNKILVMSAVTGQNKYNITMSGQPGKSIYNPDRKSIWVIIPSTDEVKEIGVTLGSTIQIVPPSTINVGEGSYGSLDENYVHKNHIWLKSRDYIRKPRENYNGDSQVQYIWKWEDDQTPELFFYDFSGDQLPTTGPYKYTGEKPLKKIIINKTPNKDINLVDIPEAQQTVFDEIAKPLQYLDDTNLKSLLPEPMEVFIGFNSTVEGVVSNKINLYKRENISFDIESNSNNYINFVLNTDATTGETYGHIEFNDLSTDLFTHDLLNVKRGLRVGQHLRVDISDSQNKKNQYISTNSGKSFKIREIYSRVLVVDFIEDNEGDIMEIIDEYTKVADYPTESSYTYLNVTFTVVDKKIANFTLSGQTESEDYRYDTLLSNFGQNIHADEAFIFKSYDVFEGGVDWQYMNEKRKEMLLNRHDIFPYIGSYKSIINAINFFGYNDLELYEYYRNINISSKDFLKLFKVEIPDIFDNTVEGWTDNDFLKHTLPNPNYEETNLFNLTYKITDGEGNKVIGYSLMEVIIKLQGLKKWLSTNIIPLTHKILDITGRADFVGETTLSHRVDDVKSVTINNSMTPIDFKINEVYLMPITSGSTVFNVVVDYYIQSENDYPDYFTTKVRTWGTYQEWQPFQTYNLGDRVTYYDTIYESAISSNKLNDPREFKGSKVWSQDTIYTHGQVVDYNRDMYKWISSTQSGTASVAPVLDTTNWLKVTKWKVIDAKPVQTISEFRLGNNLLPFNFTVDSNIDPYLVVEVTSDNGYGETYTSRKYYEIRSTKDIISISQITDPIGPFIPIVPVTRTV